MFKYFLVSTFLSLRGSLSALARPVTPAERQGEARVRRADRRGYKRTQRYSVGSFIFVCANFHLPKKKSFILKPPSVEGGLGKEQRQLLGLSL